MFGKNILWGLLFFFFLGVLNMLVLQSWMLSLLLCLGSRVAVQLWCAWGRSCRVSHHALPGAAPLTVTDISVHVSFAQPVRVTLNFSISVCFGIF